MSTCGNKLTLFKDPPFPPLLRTVLALAHRQSNVTELIRSYDTSVTDIFSLEGKKYTGDGISSTAKWMTQIVRAIQDESTFPITSSATVVGVFPQTTSAISAPGILIKGFICLPPNEQTNYQFKRISWLKLSTAATLPEHWVGLLNSEKVHVLARYTGDCVNE